MNIIIDLAAIGIIVVFAIISAKHGFVRSLIEVIGFVLEIIFIGMISQNLANIT